MAWMGAEWLGEKEGAKMDVRKQRARLEVLWAGGSRWDGWREVAAGVGAGLLTGLTAVWLSLGKGWEMCNPGTIGSP